MPETFQEKLKKLQEERAREGGAALPSSPVAPVQKFKSDHVPDVLPERDEDETAMDQLLNSIDIVQAYNKWSGKSQPTVGNGQREGIKVSCPNPLHPDKDPSAWLNLDKGAWYCAGCAEGGDAYDIAAFKFGYPRPGYKEGALFHKLRKDMAESLGYRFKKVAGGVVLMPPPEPIQPPVIQPVSNDPLPADPAQEPLASVTSLDPAEDFDKDDNVVYPTIDWRKIVQPDTFLYEYMKACSNDDSPEEYHFWHALIALGHAAGRRVVLDDSRPVYANLLLCLLGGTGTGKSRSRGWLDTVIRDAMPYRETGLDTSGVKLIPVPGSGEFLVKQFSYERKDPANVKAIIGYSPVNGIVDFDELAGMLGRGNRQGSTLKTTIMSLADARDVVSIGGLSHGTFHAEQPFCSITATTQPRAIRTLLNRTDTGSGFINRWVFAGGPTKEREIMGGSHSSMVIDLASATDELKKVYAWAGISRKLTMEPDAMAAMTKFYREDVLPIQMNDESDLLKRLDLLFKKLMLIFTVNLRSATVPLQAVQMCIELWEYVVNCYGILNENIGITHSQEISQEILRAIRNFTAKHGKGATARDISRATARKNFSPEQIKKALEVMSALDWIEIPPKPTGSHMGRPSVRYVAVGS